MLFYIEKSFMLKVVYKKQFLWGEIKNNLIEFNSHLNDDI